MMIMRIFRSFIESIYSSDDIVEKREWLSKYAIIACLFAAYFTSVLLRFAVTALFEEPLVFGDELTYRYLAYSIYKYGDPYAIKNYGHYEKMINILYPLFISPAFYFGNNFYIAIKLINCLLISAVIFPSYLIMKQFVSAKKAFFTALIIMFLPFINIANYMMTENLFFPLFLWCFFTAYKYLTTHKISYLIATIVLLILLYITKPTAIIFALACSLTSLIYHIALDKPSYKKTMLIISLIFVIIFIFTAIYYYRAELDVKSIIGSYTDTMWHLTAHWDASALNSHKFIVIMSSYIASFAAVYLLPFLVILFAFVHALKQKDTNKIVFLLLVSLTFTLYFLSTIKFTIVTSAHEPFSRLHARYYFMTYPLFIYAIVAFGPSITWDTVKKAALVGFYCLTVLLASIYLYPNYIEKKSYGFVVDNIDLSGLLLTPYLYILICLSLISTMAVYYMRTRNRFVLLPYIAFFIGISLAQNIGYVYTLRSLHLKDTDTVFARVSRNLIQQNIPGLDAKVLMIGSSPLPMLNTSFWLTYDYTDVRIHKENEEINMQNVPQDTEFIVLYDNYQLNIPFIKVAERVNGTRKCLILKAQKDI